MKFLTMLAAVLFLMNPAALWAETRVIHVLVALCDNEHQGIVPVSADLGNGDDPSLNLYWGALYGVSTHLRKHPDWSLESKRGNVSEYIPERLVFRSKIDPEVWLVADAYAGRHIKKCTRDLLGFASGQNPLPVIREDGAVVAGGRADLLVYMGHNGLMDFSLPDYPSSQEDRNRDVAVFACVSEPYFNQILIEAGARPLLMTRQLMAPEAYILAALAEGWIKREEPAALHERVARAYNKYQKCGIKAARNTFAVPGE